MILLALELEQEVCQTKWWPNQQFTFLMLAAEVNCVQAWAPARKEVLEPTLTFCKETCHADAKKQNTIK